jgi:phosphatidylglycerol:prolipoprotein diacylglycerol transferase
VKYCRNSGLAFLHTMLLHWHFDPVLLSLGPIALRWYGLLFVGAFFMGQAVLERIFKREGVPPDKVQRLLLWALLGTIAGARLVHCLVYEPARYLADPLAMLRTWDGGLASHGGALGLLLALWLANRRIPPATPFLWLVDRAAIPAALGAVFVRIANFLGSEILGVPTSGNWGVVFEAVDTLPRHPVQLYEAAGYLAVARMLWMLYRRHGAGTPRGLLLGWFMLLVFSLRVVAEHFKTPQAAYEAGLAWSMGQLLSLPFIVLGLVLVLRAGKRAPPACRIPP